jgi:23S rRNA (uracil1939-C5)-methyltransferase
VDRVIDLFAGCGTLTLPLASVANNVFAVEGSPAMTQALFDAARTSGLGERISREVRDLSTQPVEGKELAGVDAVVLDPPRAGARYQVHCLAASEVPKIAYVSCNPATFVRDARILVDGGYELKSVLPIDQFLWSPHVELVGHFERA